jgi:hypothetical protein
MASRHDLEQRTAIMMDEKDRKEFYRQIAIALMSRSDLITTPGEIVDEAGILWAEIEKATAGPPTSREKILLDALRFYADRKNWIPGEGTGSNFTADLGSVARTAIQMAGLGF